MKIYKIKSNYYCIATNAYDYFAFVNVIMNNIHATDNSFAYNYSLKIFTELFRYADDFRLLQLFISKRNA